jgi:hypothetical protein
MRKTVLILSALCGLLGAASAEETRIDIRVISHGAKFIGSGMGGASAILTDAHSGAALAEGVITGGTGDTDRLMKAPRQRGFTLSTPDAAVFHASIDLDEPRLVELTVFGPLAQRQSAVTVSVTRWILPGKHLTDGDGWLVEMPGLAVDALEPAAGGRVKAGDEIALTANVVTLCGCPIKRGGLWDADKMEVIASIKRPGVPAIAVTLEPTEKSSRFAGRLKLESRGIYQIAISAHDPVSGNSGADFTAITAE